jgi:antitoxin YefM
MYRFSPHFPQWGAIMNIVTMNEAKRTLDLLIARVFSNAEPTIITSDTGQQIILMALAEFNAWQETVYLLSNPANAAHLRQSMAEQQLGRIVRLAPVE